MDRHQIIKINAAQKALNNFFAYAAVLPRTWKQTVMCKIYTA